MTGKVAARSKVYGAITVPYLVLHSVYIYIYIYMKLFTILNFDLCEVCQS